MSHATYVGPTHDSFSRRINEPRYLDDTVLEAGEVESKPWWAGELRSGQEVRGLSSGVTRSRGRASPVRRELRHSRGFIGQDGRPTDRLVCM